MTDDVQSSHVGPRYSVEPGTICAACGSDGVTFDNVDLCKPCWRDDPQWQPGVAWYLAWYLEQRG
jgi:hypothetical protein